jgi:thioredoxin 1
VIAHNLRELNDQDFNEVTKEGLVLVDFWAPWCGPCHMQGPILERVAARVGEAATIVKVNVDEATQTAVSYRIQSIPTLVLLKNGEAVNSFVGVQDEATLVEAIEKATRT